jgi:hypothetical protein
LRKKRIANAVKQVAAYDQPLQKILIQLVEDYDYPAILNALN